MVQEFVDGKLEWWQEHDGSDRDRWSGLIIEAKVLAEIAGYEITDDEAFEYARLKGEAWKVHKNAEIAKLKGLNQEEEWEKVERLLRKAYSILLSQKIGKHQI